MSELRIVATPIGNLGDLSPRGRAALMTASSILCEDTRSALRLGQALGIVLPRLERFDAHSTPRQIQHWVERLQSGELLAVITDAGTPGVSDPAAKLVDAAHLAGVRVTPIPGPSAATALLSVSGFESAAFTFRGFFPRKKADREREVSSAMTSTVSRIFIWFESPERVNDCLETLAQAAPAAKVVAAKELTKKFERFFTGNACEVAELVSRELEREGRLGEWCVGVEFPSEREIKTENLDWEKALTILLDVRVAASEAARRVSQVFGVSKNEVYARAIELGRKKSESGG